MLSIRLDSPSLPFLSSSSSVYKPRSCLQRGHQLLLSRPLSNIGPIESSHMCKGMCAKPASTSDGYVHHRLLVVV